MHNGHPDVHTHGLADECDGCRELAEHPLRNGDRDMVRQWIELAVERPRRIPEGYNQAVAVANVLNALEHAGQLGEAAPELLVDYLRLRWHVPVALLPQPTSMGEDSGVVGEGPLYEPMLQNARDLVDAWVPWGIEHSQGFWGAPPFNVRLEDDGTHRLSVETYGWEEHGLWHSAPIDLERLRASAISLLVYCAAAEARAVAAGGAEPPAAT